MAKSLKDLQGFFDPERVAQEELRIDEMMQTAYDRGERVYYWYPQDPIKPADVIELTKRYAKAGWLFTAYFTDGRGGQRHGYKIEQPPRPPTTLEDR